MNAADALAPYTGRRVPCSFVLGAGVVHIKIAFINKDSFFSMTTTATTATTATNATTVSTTCNKYQRTSHRQWDYPTYVCQVSLQSG
jgi:uncharacterized protein YciW